MSDSVNTKIILGYYGKIRTEGDFVTRNLPRSFREPWHLWMQSIIQNIKQQMDNWGPHFLTFPVYRFALSAGICGEQAWLGVLIPSLDKVGRPYPMVLCRSLSPGENLLGANNKYSNWLEQAEALALYCLEDDPSIFSLEIFEQRLYEMDQEINAQADDEDSTSLQRVTHKYPGAAWQVNVPAIDNISPVLPDMVNILLQDFCLAYSLWWSKGAGNDNPFMMMAKGLPPIDGSSALIDGKWQQWGWEVQQ